MRDLREALTDAIVQIEYLHERFGETGSGNATVARLRAALAKPQGDGEAVPPLRLCGYCNTWNSKPCGEQCRWQTTDPTFADMSAPPSSRMRRALEYARTCIWNGCDTIEALKIIDEALRAGDNHASDTTKIKIPLPEWLGPDTPENRERLQAFVEGRNNHASDARCQCEACKTISHASSCAVHNEPAMPNGPCDCGHASDGKESEGMGGRAEIVTDYWHRHYVRNGLCSLCGNKGFIDTTGTRSPAGVECGGLHFCICPNGRAHRSASQRGWLMRLTEEEKDIDAPLERIRTEAARLGYVLVRGDREAIARSARSVLMDDPTSSDPGNWLNPMDSDGIDDLCGELADRILALRGGE